LVCLGEAIDSIKERFVGDKVSFIKHEVPQEALHKLLPAKDIKSDLRVQMLNPSLLDLRIDP
jgi:hypothetical protein